MPEAADNTQSLDGAQSFLKTIKDFWELCAVILAAFGGVVAATGAPRSIQIAAYAVAGLVLLAGAFYAHRKAQRRLKAKRRAESQSSFWEQTSAPNPAFRGLYSYQEGDVLPGQHRQLEAGRIVTQLSEPRFRFGIVGGEVGCGKTSLLRCAVQKILKGRDWGVLYVSRSAELFARLSALDPATNGQSKTLVAEYADGTPDPDKKNCAVILDQFEEVFIRYPEAEARQKIASIIKTLLDQHPNWRFLCAVRHEHVIDFQDFSPVLSDPISASNLVSVKNFTVAQAAAVIEECARLDNIEIDEKVPKTLAEDLAENDRVRPPELQIVCTALTGNLELSDYYKRGGASGILSHHIDDAISLCGDKALGSQALRLLCDFSMRTKKPPKTSEELLDEIGVRTASRERSRFLLESILTQFEQRRLVLSFNKRGQPTTYALVHDYLVGSVDAATKGVTTPAEQANQLLNYYIAEPGIRARSTVGLREFWLIKKHADKARLESPQARRLLRRSRNAVIARTLGIVVLVSISAAVVYALFTTKRGWKQTVLGQHWETGQFLGAPPIGISAKHSLVITGVGSDGGSERAKLWDMKTGAFVRAITGKDLWYSTSENFIWSREENPIVMHDLMTGKPYQIPAKNKDLILARTSSDNAVAYLETTTDQNNRSTSVVKIWSIFNQTEVGKTYACNVSDTQRNYLTANGDRLVRLCWNDGRQMPLLWDTKQEQPIAALTVGNSSSSYFQVNEKASLIATDVWTDQPVCRIQLWDLASGRPLRAGNVNTEYCRSEFEWVFTPDGSYLIIQKNGEVVSLLSASDLSPPHWFSATYNDALIKKAFGHYLAWQTAEGTFLWKVDTAEPRFYKDMKLARTGERFVIFGFFIQEQHNRAVIDKINGFEIWNLQTGERLHDILFTEDSTDFSLSLDEATIVYTLPGGGLVMYSIVTGERIGELADTGGSQRVVYYDARCKTAYVWTGEGRVLRYSQGTEVLGRWFFPTTKCGSQVKRQG